MSANAMFETLCRTAFWAERNLEESMTDLCEKAAVLRHKKTKSTLEIQ